MAARAEVTLFDEPYAGLDAVARQVFYDRLLADVAQFPRTVLLSTHLIDEAAALFDGVVVYGMWYGIVYNRWGLLGTVAFIAAQALVIGAGVVVVTSGHWHALTAMSLTGVIAALTVLLLAGGHATIRRTTV